jgi:hypothetical protein
MPPAPKFVKASLGSAVSPEMGVISKPKDLCCGKRRSKLGRPYILVNEFWWEKMRTRRTTVAARRRPSTGWILIVDVLFV